MKARTQTEHEAYNSCHYPGTRQMCFECDEPTDRCEEDQTVDNNGNPLCDECLEEYDFDELECFWVKKNLKFRRAQNENTN